MNRRLVRIYKDPKGNGDYVNKTKAFLQKAQMGAETQAAPNVNAYLQYIYEQLKNDAEPDDVLTDLVANGLNEDVAYQLLSNVVDQMLESGEMNPDNPITNQERQEQASAQEQQAAEQQQPQEEEEAVDPATDYFNSYANEPEYTQPDLEFQDGGESDEEYEEDNVDRSSILSQYSTNNTPDESSMQDSENTDFDTDSSDVLKYGFLNQKSQYPGLQDYYEGFLPLSWEPVDTSLYKKGGSKKAFAKNVLKRLQAGGQEQQPQDNSIGQGDKFDTITSDVSKIKNNFIDAVKEKANKAKLDETYDKMMNSGNQDLMMSAQALAQSQNESQQEESFFQSGGYVGEGAPHMFMYGGADLPFYEADFLPEAQDGAEVRKAKINYVPNPVLPASRGTGLFGIGKRKTYSNMPYNALTKEVYKDSLEGLTPYARTVHKRGIFGRPKRWTDWYTEKTNDVLTPGQEIKEAYEKAIKKQNNAGKETDLKKEDTKKVRPFNMSEEEWDKLSLKEKRKEKKWAKMALKEIEANKNRVEDFGDFTMRTHDAQGKKLKVPEIVNIYRWPDEKKEEPVIDNGVTLPDGLSDEDIAMLDADKLNQEYQEKKEEIEQDNKRKKDFGRIDDPNRIKAEWEKINDNLNIEKPEQKLTLKDFYLQNEEKLRQEENQKRLGGGLSRYQFAGGVKSPTNNLSTVSDPTANTFDLTNVLKPAKNPNTLIGMSLPYMNQTTPVDNTAPKEKPIIMDPNQTKDQKITSLDFADKKKTLYAQDFKKAGDFDGAMLNDAINATGNWFANMMNKRDAARQEKEMYENNFTSDSIYGASSNKDRGDYVAYGQQTGMFRPDQAGNDTMGRFAYGQMGGYMGDYDYDVDDEVDMTEEELAEFLANGGEVEYLES